MKKLSLLLILFLTAIVNLDAQIVNGKPLVVIDGNISNVELDSIDMSVIRNFEVLQNSQSLTDDFGILARNGVIRIKTKDFAERNAMNEKNTEPLILMNGEVYTSGINTIDPGIIKEITVLKDVSATKTYGKAGRNGVILISSAGKSQLDNKGRLPEIP
jgi:hypothetical protein